ncbi:cytochrome p450 oxidoreductase protein [Rutstroemia sp. NJR-2017a BBW]|nr:cytochrome p450 oxidoreductase protein [Rutstroemia sp. NJR-2017a BBW]
MTTIVHILAAIAVAYMLSQAILYYTQASNEPPVVNSGIPFLSLILDYLRYKSRVFSVLKEKYHLLVYTLWMSWCRLYIINFLDLIKDVQRPFRIINFAPLAAPAAANILGTSEATCDVVFRDTTTDEGFFLSFNKTVQISLSPGASLDSMYEVAIRTFAAFFSDFAVKGHSNVPLLKWMRHPLVLGTTDAVYGPQNPFRISSVEEAWYTDICVETFPQNFAKEAFEAREHLVQAFENYFSNGFHRAASTFVKVRYEHTIMLSGYDRAQEYRHKYNQPLSQLHWPSVPYLQQIIKNKISNLNGFSRFELGSVYGVLGNTVPATYWLILHIYRDPIILEECRQELYPLIQEKDGIRSINVEQIKSSFTEDYILSDKYLLKKGSIAGIPSEVQHFESTWGPDASSFNYRIFLDSTGCKIKRPNRPSFRAIGGDTLPRSRFWPLWSTKGDWVLPSVAHQHATGLSILTPDNDVDIEIRPRRS